jgi:hypothetical protein
MCIRLLRLSLLAAVLCLAPLSETRAGPLAPSVPSQILQVRTFGTACATIGNEAYRFDLLTTKSGSAVFSYEVPAKQVAVIRSIRFSVATTASTSTLVILENAGNLITYHSGVSEANGAFEGTFEFDPGLVVSSLANLCIRRQGGGQVAANLTGFLAKDK